MGKNWDDYKSFLVETESEAQMRAEQEKLAPMRNEILGTHVGHSQSSHAFKSKLPVKTGRMKTRKVDTSSRAWKNYREGRITFAEMKKRLGI